MFYANEGSFYLKDGYLPGSFSDYVSARLDALSRPMQAPCYASPDEQEQLDRLYDAVQADPYRWYDACSQRAARMLAQVTTHSVTRITDPVLYACAQDSCAALGITSFAVFTLEHPTIARYDAAVVHHMDISWILVSHPLREHNLLSDLELTFLIGRQLGHSAAHHEDIRQTQKNLSSDALRRHEYTADCAGLLAVLWRIQRLDPDLSSDQMVERALDQAFSALQKLDVLHRAENKRVFSQPSLQMAVDERPVQAHRAAARDEQPTLWERMEALQEYVISIPFLHCIGTLWGKDHPIALHYDAVAMLQRKQRGQRV